MTPPSSSCGTWTCTRLYRFGHGGTDGANPYGLAKAETGTLYGSTNWGGTWNQGTVYALQPPAAGGGSWTESVLWNFGDGSYPDGAFPGGGVVIGPEGTLYGSTTGGGAALAGTVYAVIPPAAPRRQWIETLLHVFSGLTDGLGPTGSPNLAANGALYGATARGGGPAGGDGAVYTLLPPATKGGFWREHVLYSFTGGNEGSQPNEPAPSPSGALYTTTQFGGSANGGAVIELTPPAAPGSPFTATVLHTFGIAADGANPGTQLLRDSDGTLYGVTESGGNYGNGTIFALTPPSNPGGAWTYTVLHQFTGGADGAIPKASLVIDKRGALYGTTYGGGAGFGTVFRLSR